jgi:hypothetical protein
MSLTYAVVAQANIVLRDVVLSDLRTAELVEFESILVVSNAIVEPSDLECDILERIACNQRDRSQSEG